MRERILHDGKLDAEFLNLVAFGRVEGASQEERELAELLRLEGLRAVRTRLGLPENFPVIPLVIQAPRAHVNNRTQRNIQRRRR